MMAFGGKVDKRIVMPWIPEIKPSARSQEILSDDIGIFFAEHNDGLFYSV